VLEDDALDRDAVVAAVEERGVGTSIYYPSPVPRMRYYRDRYGYEAGMFPHAEQVSDRSVALPVGPHVSPDEATHVGNALAAALGCAG
jgi:dTDP-4-amino-4,6-dideoxygalactose transaminase